MVVGMLKLNKLNICCLQEIEIPENYPETVLNFGGYNLELEKNNEKIELEYTLERISSLGGLVRWVVNSHSVSNAEL